MIQLKLMKAREGRFCMGQLFDTFDQMGNKLRQLA